MSIVFQSFPFWKFYCPHWWSTIAISIKEDEVKTYLSQRISCVGFPFTFKRASMNFSGCFNSQMVPKVFRSFHLIFNGFSTIVFSRESSIFMRSPLSLITRPLEFFWRSWDPDSLPVKPLEFLWSSLQNFELELLWESMGYLWGHLWISLETFSNSFDVLWGPLENFE